MNTFDDDDIIIRNDGSWNFRKAFAIIETKLKNNEMESICKSKIQDYINRSFDHKEFLNEIRRRE